MVWWKVDRWRIEVWCDARTRVTDENMCSSFEFGVLVQQDRSVRYLYGPAQSSPGTLLLCRPLFC